MPWSQLTSKQLAVVQLGIYDVQAYEVVKVFYMKMGQELADALLRQVGGRPADNGEECDGITALGSWEFCLSRNSKNKAGDAHDRLRAAGFCVQMLERPRPDWISGREFLSRHDTNPLVLDDLALEVATNVGSRFLQLRLPV